MHLQEIPRNFFPIAASFTRHRAGHTPATADASGESARQGHLRPPYYSQPHRMRGQQKPPHYMKAYFSLVGAAFYLQSPAF